MRTRGAAAAGDGDAATGAVKSSNDALMSASSDTDADASIAAPPPPLSDSASALESPGRVEAGSQGSSGSEGAEAASAAGEVEASSESVEVQSPTSGRRVSISPRDLFAAVNAERAASGRRDTNASEEAPPTPTPGEAGREVHYLNEVEWEFSEEAEMNALRGINAARRACLDAEHQTQLQDASDARAAHHEFDTVNRDKEFDKYGVSDDDYSSDTGSTSSGFSSCSTYSAISAISIVGTGGGEDFLRRFMSVDDENERNGQERVVAREARDSARKRGASMASALRSSAPAFNPTAHLGMTLYPPRPHMSDYEWGGWLKRLFTLPASCLARSVPAPASTTALDRRLECEQREHNMNAMKATSAERRGDITFMLAAVREWGCALQFASKALRQNKQLVLEAVAQSGRALRYADKRLRGNKQVVGVAVGEYGGALAHASAMLKGDRDIVVIAVRNYCSALKFASPKLQSDRSVVSIALERGYWSFQHASAAIQAEKRFSSRYDALRSDKRRVRQGVVRNPAQALRLAALMVQLDRDIVLTAVEYNGKALEFAPPSLRADRAIVLVAVAQCTAVLRFASLALRNDREVVLAAAATSGSALADASPTLQRDEIFVTRIIWMKGGRTLRFASPQLKLNRRVVLTAVSLDGMALGYANPTLQADPVVVLAAVQQNGKALKHADRALLANAAIVAAAVKQHPRAIKHAARVVRTNKELLLGVIASEGAKWSRKIIPAALRSDPDIRRALAASSSPRSGKGKGLSKALK